MEINLAALIHGIYNRLPGFLVNQYIMPFHTRFRNNSFSLTVTGVTVFGQKLYPNAVDSRVIRRSVKVQVYRSVLEMHSSRLVFCAVVAFPCIRNRAVICIVPDIAADIPSACGRILVHPCLRVFNNAVIPAGDESIPPAVVRDSLIVFQVRVRSSVIRSRVERTHILWQIKRRMQGYAQLQSGGRCKLIIRFHLHPYCADSFDQLVLLVPVRQL